MPLKILLTTLELESYTGLPLYTRDIAIEFKRQGHIPEVYTLTKGKVADELINAGIFVTDIPSQIKIRPDIIHGQHRVSTLIAVKQFRSIPAIFIVHNHTFWGDEAPFHPRIRRYFGVSRVCMERLAQDGVPEGKIRFLSNFVDTNRFLPRAPLPAQPQKALIFSNYATEKTHLPAVREACRQAGLDLDVIGMHTNYLIRPETVLRNYDIIFAKAKAAIEALATGAAVILCDFSGVGPMVTTAEFDNLRLMNFGFQSLTQPLQPEYVLAQIARYNPKETLKVQNLIRSTASLENAARHLIEIYQSVMDEYKNAKTNRTVAGARPSFRESFYWERARFWASLNPAQDNILKSFSINDPAAREKTYQFSRPVFTRETKSSFIKSLEKTTGMIKSLPVSIWMIFPESIRTEIKKLPFVSALANWLKKLIFAD